MGATEQLGKRGKVAELELPVVHLFLGRGIDQLDEPLRAAAVLLSDAVPNLTFLDAATVAALGIVVELNVSAPDSTPPGAAVVVEPIDSSTGQTPVELTFDSVDTGGVTTLATSSLGPPTPSGFSLGDPPTFFEIRHVTLLPSTCSCSSACRSCNSSRD